MAKIQPNIIIVVFKKIYLIKELNQVNLLSLIEMFSTKYLNKAMVITWIKILIFSSKDTKDLRAYSILNLSSSIPSNNKGKTYIAINPYSLKSNNNSNNL